MDVVRQNLSRSVRFETSDASSDGLTLEGYGAVFNEVTRIDSVIEGLFDEQIQPGAFKKTLEGRTPILQFDHGAHPLLGSLPLGHITEIHEDSRGLFVQARLHDNWMVEPVRDAIASGSVSGMSFRFNVVNDIWENSGDVPLRTITEVKLHEVGPVVFPAYEQTTVGVRSAVQEVLTDKDLRAELARALILGTPDGQPSGEDTGEGAASIGEPSIDTRRSKEMRRRLARRALSDL